MYVCLFAILTGVLADTDIFLPSTGAHSQSFMKLMLGFTFGEQQGALSIFVLSDCLLYPMGIPWNPVCIHGPEERPAKELKLEKSVVFSTHLPSKSGHWYCGSLISDEVWHVNICYAQCNTITCTDAKVRIIYLGDFCRYQERDLERRKMVDYKLFVLGKMKYRMLDVLQVLLLPHKHIYIYIANYTATTCSACHF